MSGRRGSGRERNPRGSQKRKAAVDIEIVVKTEDESETLADSDKEPESAEMETRWEWLSDGDLWMVYADDLNIQINQAFSTGRQSVAISPEIGISLVVDLRNMVQKNKKSGYQRPIRLAVKEQDQFFVWQWLSDDDSWISYDAKTSIFLETALHTDSKIVSLSLGGKTYIIDLGAMVQKNTMTQYERQIQRCLSVALDASMDDENDSLSNGPSSAKRFCGSRSVDSGDSESEESKEHIRTILLKGKAPVDPECSSKLGKAHVYSEGEDVYDVMLNQEALRQHFMTDCFREQDWELQKANLKLSHQRMSINVKHLIQQVETHPELWDASSDGYSDRQAREDAWTNIFRHLYPTWDAFTTKDQGIIEKDIKNRWRSVRDRFRKEMSMEEKSGTSPSKRKPYQYMQLLMFLRQARQPPQTSSGLDKEMGMPLAKESEPLEGSSVPIVVETEQVNTDFAVAGQSTEPVPPPRVPPSKSGGKCIIRSRAKITQELDDEILALLRRTWAEDDADAFSRTLADRIRWLPEPSRSRFMAYVLSSVEYFLPPFYPPEVDTLVANLRMACTPQSGSSQFQSPQSQ
ncbi:hypothetical protein GDO81_001957 [Engystomops pustulosus]|uniref:MADF domain-containing protein n=1 Tax=Engystomops pustulosus TaxID=76066 RepID=A0AAV7DII6_ENGPU|nr:hypothetical protein GDO81_001957 [Engystomops pustulosus]